VRPNKITTAYHPASNTKWPKGRNDINYG
jgi:hypothetical protein